MPVHTFSHLLNQWWPSSMIHTCITGLQSDKKRTSSEALWLVQKVSSEMSFYAMWLFLLHSRCQNVITNQHWTSTPDQQWTFSQVPSTQQWTGKLSSTGKSPIKPCTWSFSAQHYLNHWKVVLSVFLYWNMILTSSRVKNGWLDLDIIGWLDDIN